MPQLASLPLAETARREGANLIDLRRGPAGAPHRVGPRRPERGARGLAPRRDDLRRRRWVYNRSAQFRTVQSRCTLVSTALNCLQRCTFTSTASSRAAPATRGTSSGPARLGPRVRSHSALYHTLAALVKRGLKALRICVGTTRPRHPRRREMDLQIGFANGVLRGDDHTEYFYGMIDDVRLYSRVRRGRTRRHAPPSAIPDASSPARGRSGGGTGPSEAPACPPPRAGAHPVRHTPRRCSRTRRSSRFTITRCRHRRMVLGVLAKQL